MRLHKQELKEPYTVVEHGLGTRDLIVTVEQGDFLVTAGIQLLSDDKIAVSIPGLMISAIVRVWSLDAERKSNGRKSRKDKNE